jgi:hypothetical protein
MAAALAGAAMVALLGWTLWTVTTDPPLDGPGEQAVVVRSPGTPAPRVSPDLPVAPDTPQATADGPAPRPMSVAEGPPQGPDGVLGLVLDAATGKPVPVFQVHVMTAGSGDPLERLAGSTSQAFHVLTGVFFVQQEKGLWDVVVQAPGYEPAVLTGLPTPAREREPLRFELARGPGIVGLVLDEVLMPVAGIKTFLEVTELFDPEAKPPFIRTVTTGADGRFSYSPLPAGEYAVTLLEPDNEDDRVSGLRVLGDTVTIDMYLHPRHELTVKVQAEDGSPLADVLVEARSEESHYAHGQTNENGLVLLEHLPDGTYTLTATRPGEPPHVEEVELFGGSSQEVRWLTLSP